MTALVTVLMMSLKLLISRYKRVSAIPVSLFCLGAYRGSREDLDRVGDGLGNVVGVARQVSDRFEGLDNVGGRDGGLHRRGGQERW